MSRTRSRLRGWTVVFLVLSSLLAFGQFEDTETALRRADTAFGQGRFDYAQLIYDRALRDNPNLPLTTERCRNIADANMRATHPNMKAGVDWLQKATDQSPSDEYTRAKLADALLRSGENTRAVVQYQKLLSKSPDNQQYVLGVAIAQRNLGQYEEAATLLNSTLKAHPDYKLLRLELGRNLSYQRDFKGATEQYEEVQKNEPDNLQARLGMAKVLSWQGEQDKALVVYDKVLQRDPGNYDALVGEAFSLIWTGRQNEAIPILERANSRHPEDTEVRDALKRLGGVTVFTGEVRAGETPLPILPPAGRRPTPKASASSTATTEAKASKPAPPETTPPQPEKQDDSAATTPASSGERRTVWWVLGMGAMMMVGVFAIAGFLLFIVPSMRQKREAEEQAISNPIASSKPVEPWARLEEFSRAPREEAEAEAATASKPSLPATEHTLLPSAAETLRAALNRSNGTPPPADEVKEPETTPVEAAASEASPADDRPRGPRRRRGVADRPWWREMPLPDPTTSAAENATFAALENLNAKSQAAPQPASPIIDAYDSDTVVMPAGAANPLAPASQRPHLDEAPPTRPFTVVLSRALERAGDGQVEGGSSAAIAPDPEHPSNGNGHGNAVDDVEVSETDPETLRALQGSTAVIVGCGVLVSHYRSLLRAAGVEVRLFTFWDLAMTSMRKRRADILIIDGDALDGFTSKQMYASAHVERYMFGVVLVGVASDDDRSTLPEEVVLPHSLSDTDIRARLVESRAS